MIPPLQTPGEIYADGVVDGMAITLRLLLGEAARGGQPYRGELPDEAKAWAEHALKTMAAAGVKEAVR